MIFCSYSKYGFIGFHWNKTNRWNKIEFSDKNISLIVKIVHCVFVHVSFENNVFDIRGTHWIIFGIYACVSCFVALENLRFFLLSILILLKETMNATINSIYFQKKIFVLFTYWCFFVWFLTFGPEWNRLLNMLLE